MYLTTTDTFDYGEVKKTLRELDKRCNGFQQTTGAGAIDHRIEFSVEARYRHQVWEIEVPLRQGNLDSAEELAMFIEDFHATHESIFGFRDQRSEIEIVGWTGRVRCRMRSADVGSLDSTTDHHQLMQSRPVYVTGEGEVDVPLYRFDTLDPGEALPGPAIVESPFTTVVVDPGSSLVRTEAGSLVIDLEYGAKE